MSVMRRGEGGINEKPNALLQGRECTFKKSHEVLGGMSLAVQGSDEWKGGGLKGRQMSVVGVFKGLYGKNGDG